MKNLVLIIATCLIVACANQPTRSKITTDSGRPLSESQKRFDIGHYTLKLEIFPEQQKIAGSADIEIRASESMQLLELDFDGQLSIDAIRDASGKLEYRRDEARLYIDLRDELPAGSATTISVAYHGKPLVAAKAPWDGGFVWARTPSGKPWIATAVQGEGCDLWWPCKDHPTGEPSSMDLYFTVPQGLTAASNGVLVEVIDAGRERKTFHWRTSVPSNTYGIALNIAPYVLLESSYQSSNGTLIPLQFWVIEEHEDEARKLFDAEFADTIEFFERKVGPYPWGQEKLGVAETPHLGMEHQTINAYGNEFKRDKYGFDWLFHHELAHEWFGNVMTHSTVSDMWLHEGFGAFMQPEYTREVMGDAAFYARMYPTYLGIKSCNPIAPREEFSEDELYFDDPEGKGPGGDIYSKGTWLLHSLRYVIGEDAFWRSVRRLVYDTTEPQTLSPPIAARLRSTDDYVAIVSEEAGRDMAWFFEVYARRGPLPRLAVSVVADAVQLEWQEIGDLDFPMPVPVRVDGQMQRVEFAENRAVLTGVTIAEIQIDPYMQILRKLPTVPTCEERREEEKEAEANSD